MELKNRIIELIVKSGIFEVDNIGIILRNTDDLQEVGINSLNFIKLIVAIENEFEIEFEDDDLDHTRFKTLTAICNYIESRYTDIKDATIVCTKIEE